MREKNLKALASCCRLVAESIEFTHPQLQRHIHTGSGGGVLKVLAILSGSAKKPDWPSIKAEHRRELREYLLQVNSSCSCSTRDIQNRRHT